MTVIIAGTMRAPPENLDKLLEHLKILVASTLEEPGCLSYRISFDPLELGVICVAERYVDEAAFTAHRTSPHMLTWREASAPLGLGSRDLSAFTVSDQRKL